MTSSSRASVTQSKSLERSGVPALKDTLALFEQSLADQEHWSKQLAEDHAVSVKAVAEKAATHAAELQKILTGKEAPPLLQTDFKLYGKDSTNSGQARNDKGDEVRYGHLHGFTDHHKSDGSSKARFYEDKGCLDRSRGRSMDRKLGGHHHGARSRSPNEIDPYYCSDRRRRRSRSRDNTSKHQWMGARSRSPNDVGCLDRTSNKNMDRRLGGHHRRARSRSPNEIDPYYCSDWSRSTDNTSKHRSDRSRSRERNGSRWHGDRNRYGDKRSLHHGSDRARSRDRSSDRRRRSSRSRDRVSRREKI